MVYQKKIKNERTNKIDYFALTFELQYTAIDGCVVAQELKVLHITSLM